MNEELQELLRTPREDMDIELKQWMDPTDKVVRAKLAKELLALRNHGGGYLVIGYKDGHPPTPDYNRPTDLSVFSTDAVNNIVKKYAEPPFHCTSYLIDHPGSGEQYPVIVVPGGAQVPVRCKSDSPDDGKSIRKDAYYIRRPGPESSPPQSAAEWDVLLEQCLLSRKEALLASLSGLLGVGRSGLLSGATLPEPKHPFTELRAFRDDAVSRLVSLQATLPEDAGARFLHGRYILSARILDTLKKVSTSEMLDILSRLPKYTGWSPIHIFTRRELEPYPYGDDIIECWLAREEPQDPGHADFWRVSTNGMVTLIRGHQEDSPEINRDGLAPGTGIELTLPPWRIAEFILRVAALARRLTEDNFRLQLIVQWEGIAGRKLFSYGGRRMLFQEYVAHDPNFSIEIEATPEEIESALPNVIAKTVTPLLRRFSFFEPPTEFYNEEISKLLNREYK